MESMPRFTRSQILHDLTEPSGFAGLPMARTPLLPPGGGDRHHGRTLLLFARVSPFRSWRWTEGSKDIQGALNVLGAMNETQSF